MTPDTGSKPQLLQDCSRGMGTPGPWRWEINEASKNVRLVGGEPRYDLTILEPARWGMSSATLLVRDTAFGGLNVLHKLHDRRDWIAPFPGRAHHANWCASVVHPDMRLIEAAPDLLDALQMAKHIVANEGTDAQMQQVFDAIEKATGQPA